MKFNNGFENISVKLLNFTGEDLARQVVMFGNVAEFYEGINGDYSPENPLAKRIVSEIIEGKTFPKYALEGHNVSFQINGISRICLAQLTREKGFFCSASGDVRPLTQEFNIPMSIYQNKKWMDKLSNIQKQIEELYIDMLENEIPYMDARYIGLHSQVISLTYCSPIGNWLKSCNSRTENNFADEINYIYRLMLRELWNEVIKINDPLSRKLWTWLLGMADNKKFYTRDHTYNNDFQRFNTPKNYDFGETAHNNWKKSGWKLELERINKNNPELLFSGEKTMIENFDKLPSTYDSEADFVGCQAIKKTDYYNYLHNQDDYERAYIDSLKSSGE